MVALGSVSGVVVHFLYIFDLMMQACPTYSSK